MNNKKTYKLSVQDLEVEDFIQPIILSEFLLGVSFNISKIGSFYFYDQLEKLNLSVKNIQRIDEKLSFEIESNGLLQLADSLDERRVFIKIEVSQLEGLLVLLSDLSMGHCDDFMEIFKFINVKNVSFENFFQNDSIISRTASHGVNLVILNFFFNLVDGCSPDFSEFIQDLSIKDNEQIG